MADKHHELSNHSKPKNPEERTVKAGRPRLPARDRAGALLKARVTTARKVAYQRAAKRSKKTLAKWMIEKLDAALANGE